MAGGFIGAAVTGSACAGPAEAMTGIQHASRTACRKNLVHVENKGWSVSVKPFIVQKSLPYKKRCKVNSRYQDFCEI
jgi:hypothetical protein